MRYRFDRYTDETINTSLLYLRAQIIRDDLDGLSQVDELLSLRGVEPDRVPPRRGRAFRKGELRRAVLEALNGPAHPSFNKKIRMPLPGRWVKLPCQIEGIKAALSFHEIRVLPDRVEQAISRHS